jgi:hypothetical protein
VYFLLLLVQKITRVRTRKRTRKRMEGVATMRSLVVLLIISLVLTMSVPAYAGNVLDAIPADYYGDILAGAAIQGLVRGTGAAPMESLYISIGVAITREIIDSAFLGGEADWTRAATMVLGSSFVYYF